MVVCAYNSSTREAWGRKVDSSRPAWSKQIARLCLIIKQSKFNPALFLLGYVFLYLYSFPIATRDFALEVQSSYLPVNTASSLLASLSHLQVSLRSPTTGPHSAPFLMLNPALCAIVCGDGHCLGVVQVGGGHRDPVLIGLVSL